MHNVTIKQLRAFMALKAEHNFTRAAASVFLSQPAFSALINGLENEVGFRLFDRDTRSVRLTPDGEMFTHIATRFIKMHQASIQEVEAIANGGKGRVCLAALPSVAVNWLPAVVPPFRKEYPKVRVDLIDAPSDRCIQALEDGIADLALTAFNVSNDEFTSEKIYTEPFYFVCRDDHPLAGLKSVRMEALVNYPIINFAQSTSIRQHLDGKIPSFVSFDNIEVEQLTTMMGLVMAGIGASIIPELALYQFKVNNIVHIPFEDLGAYRDIHLIKRADRTLSIAAKNICDMLIKHVRLMSELQQDARSAPAS